jgi:beta-1,4-N-acetylglucosaminyltransferase
LILVTVGTHNRGFDRLVRAADELATLTDEPVVIQYGSAVYEPRHASRSFRFTTSQEMEDLTLQARVIIMHAAAGSLILALKMGKPLVVVPRLKKYKEVMDDHQIQLAKALAEQDRVILVIRPSGEGLLQAVMQAVKLGTRLLGNSQLKIALQKQLARWDTNRRNA